MMLACWAPTLPLPHSSGCIVALIMPIENVHRLELDKAIVVIQGTELDKAIVDHVENMTWAYWNPYRALMWIRKEGGYHPLNGTFFTRMQVSQAKGVAAGKPLSLPTAFSWGTRCFDLTIAGPPPPAVHTPWMCTSTRVFGRRSTCSSRLPCRRPVTCRHFSTGAPGKTLPSSRQEGSWLKLA